MSQYRILQTKLYTPPIRRELVSRPRLNAGLIMRGAFARALTLVSAPAGYGKTTLVMPNDVAGSERIMDWIATRLPRDTYVHIMAQYTPRFRAYDYPEISRRITSEEWGWDQLSKYM